MSIKIMSQVYESDIEDIYEHSVLMALANHCDDDGVCYPSMARIARLARVRERGCRKIIQRLIQRGIITVEYNAGPRGTNVFMLHLTPGTSCLPVPDTPGTGQQGPRHGTAKTPAPHAPEPSITVNRTVNIGRSADLVRDSISRFKEFWDAYPHRGGAKRNRKGAEAKYRAAVKRGASEQEIIDGAIRSQRDPAVRAGYARDPSTWLNQSGWEDEIPDSPPLKAVGGHQRNGPKPVWRQVNERAERQAAR